MANNTAILLEANQSVTSVKADISKYIERSKIYKRLREFETESKELSDLAKFLLANVKEKKLMEGLMSHVTKEQRKIDGSGEVPQHLLCPITLVPRN